MTLLIKESSLDVVATLLSDMSVTSCEGMNSLGSGKSRYDPPDAPLSNAATRSARHYKRLFGSPPSLSFLLHGGDQPIPWARRMARHPALTPVKPLPALLVRSAQLGPPVGGVEHGEHRRPLGALSDLRRAGQQ